MLCWAERARGLEITPQSGSRDPTTCLASAPAASCLERYFSAFGFLLTFPPQGWVLWLPLCLCRPTRHVLALFASNFCCLKHLPVYLFGFVLSPPSRTCPQPSRTVTVLLPAESWCPEVTVHRGADWGAGLLAGCEGLHQDHPGEGAAQPMGRTGLLPQFRPPGSES